MPVTKIRSRWDSGNLIFHESTRLDDEVNVLTLDPDIVTIGNADNDVDFKIHMGTEGTGEAFALFNCGEKKVYFTGLSCEMDGDLTITAEDISLILTKHIYFDGQGGDEYIVSDTADHLMLNAKTLINLAINGTDEVVVSGAALYPFADDGQTLGILASNEWSDLFLADGGVIGWNNNDVTITHSTDELTVASTWTANAVGRPWGVNLTLSVVGGNYVNAIKGYVDCTTNDGGTIGLLSAVNCEIAMPAQCRGAYYPLEIEWVGKVGTAFDVPGTGSQSGFMWINCSGTRDYIDSAGVFFTLIGLTAELGGMLSANAQTLRVDIDQGTTRYLVMSQIQNGIGLGINGTEIEYTAGTPVFSLYAECDNTTATNSEPFYVYSIVDGVGGDGGRSRFHTYSNVASGTNLMALKAQMEFGATGTTDGRAAAFCAELNMPNVNMGPGGVYSVLELEYVAEDNALVTRGSLTGNHVSFIAANNTGDTNGDFDDNGYLMVFTGLYDDTDNLFYDNTLRIGVNTATWYLPLSSVQGSYTTAYPIASTNDTAINITSTFVPDQYYTDYALAIGFKLEANEISVEFKDTTNQNLNLIQMNVNCTAETTDTGPTGSSQMNLKHSLITHDTDDMDNLRLKCTDYNIDIKKDLQDAYVYQGEIDFGASDIAVGGEAAVMGLVMNAGSSTVTGNLRGMIISMQGTGTYDTAVGIELRTTCGTGLGNGLSEGIRISGTPLPVVGIAMGRQDNDNEGPQFAFFFPAGPSADEGPVRHTVDTGEGDGSIAIKVGSVTKWLKYWASELP